MSGHVRKTRMSRRITRGFSPEALRKARLDADLTRGELARLAHVSVGSVQAWETGRAAPQIDSLVKVLDVLEIKITDVVLIEPSDRYLGDLRVLRGLTQTELAKRLGISTTTLSQIELGHTLSLRESVAIDLARELGVSHDEINRVFRKTQDRPRETRL